MMADYDIFRNQLLQTFPAYGYALWDPNPTRPDKPVQVGDVGFMRWGKFHRLFNALLPADHPSHERGVPEYHEPLVPTFVDHINTGSLNSGHYCSGEVNIEPEPNTGASPDDLPQVSYMCPRRRQGASSFLPVNVRRENTLAKSDFGEWMLKHIDNWFAFARRLGLGIEQMEDIILVTGCDRTKSWTNVTFLGSNVDARVSFGVNAVGGPNASVNFQFSPENVRGAVLNQGPEGTNLPENQCVFIRGFRVARPLRILPRHLKAAAGPSPDPEGYDYEPGMELVSIPEDAKYRDPLHQLLDHVAERTPDCSMILVHDDDLERIHGIGAGTALQPDVLMDLFRRSNIEIHKVDCDLPSSTRSPNTDTHAVRVAMLSAMFKNWKIGNDTALQSQASSPASQSIRHISGSLASLTRTSPDSLSSPGLTNRGDMCEHKRSSVEDSATHVYGQGPPRHTHSEPWDDIPLPWLTVPVRTTRSKRGVDHWGTYWQGPMPPSLQPGIGHVTSLQQPPICRSYFPAFHQLVPSQVASVPCSPRHFNFSHVRTPELFTTTSSHHQDLTSVQHTVGGPYYRRLTPSHATLLPPSVPLPRHELAVLPQRFGLTGRHYLPPPTPVLHPSIPLCTKKRKALIIGINYASHPNPAFRLTHGVEDAHSMANFLCADLGFAHNDIHIMTDTNHPCNTPTKENILRGMRALVQDAQPHDSLFFYFSGHALQAKDIKGDGPDGLDECICATDYLGDDLHPSSKTRGLIVDDVMHEILVKPLPSQCRLTAMFDSCNSGTLLDLPYFHISNDVKHVPRHQERPRVFRHKASHPDGVSAVDLDDRLQFLQFSLSTSKGSGGVSETRGGGALRSAFIKSLKEYRNGLLWMDLFKSVCDYLKGYRFPQRPQCPCCHIYTDIISDGDKSEIRGRDPGQYRALADF